MRKRLCLFFCAVIASACVSAFAQVQVRSVELDYEPYSGYRFPVITGDTRAVQDMNTFLQVTILEHAKGHQDVRLFDEVRSGDFRGLVQIDYVRMVSPPNILSLYFTSEYIGAYSTYATFSHNFNMHTGQPIDLKVLLTPQGSTWFAQKMKMAQIIRIEAYLKGEAGSELREGYDQSDFEVQEHYYTECLTKIRNYEGTDANWGDELLFKPDGIEVSSQCYFPHVSQAYDVLGKTVTTLSYEQLKAHLSVYGQCLLIEQRDDCSTAALDVVPGVWRGSIGGKYPIVLVMEGSRIIDTNYYFYAQHQKLIELNDVAYDAKTQTISMNEGRDTQFSLRYTQDGKLSGHWMQGSRKLTVELSQN